MNICWWLNNIKTYASFFVIVIDIINFFIWKVSFTSIISYFLHIYTSFVALKIPFLLTAMNKNIKERITILWMCVMNNFYRINFLLFFHLSWLCLSCINNDAININSIQYVVLYSNEASRSPQQIWLCFHFLPFYFLHSLNIQHEFLGLFYANIRPFKKSDSKQEGNFYSPLHILKS